MLEGKLEPNLADSWRWRPGAKLNAPTAYPLPLKDMNELPEFDGKAKL